MLHAGEYMTDTVATGAPETQPRFVRFGRRITPKTNRARLSVDTAHSFGWNNVIVGAPDWESHWRDFDLDRKTLDTISPANLLEIMSNLSPEISRAIWDFTTMFNPGLTIRAYQTGTVDQEDATGQDAINAFLAVLDERHGDFDIIIEKLIMAAYMRGAFFAELILDEGGTVPIDLVTPDPLSVTFKKQRNLTYGEYWQLGQYQEHEWVALDRPTVRYFPIHPKPGSPYGRSPATPALFPALFILMMLHDLRRVVAQQGYPRIDIAIDTEMIRASQPDTDADDFNDLVNDIVDDVVAAYESLEPDDAYIHPSYITVNLSQGAVDSKSLDGADPIIAALERMSMRALKLTPLMMGQTAGISEANANRQWEMWVRSIKQLQERCAELLESLFTVALRVQGIQSKVHVEFGVMRQSEKLRDEQALQMAMTNADLGERLGYYDRNEASEHAVGHPPKGERMVELTPETDGQKVDPLDPNASLDGEELADDTFRGEGRQRRDKLIPLGSVEDLDDVPTFVEIDDEMQRNAIAQFDTWMPEYAGLLNATIVGE